MPRLPKRGSLPENFGATSRARETVTHEAHNLENGVQLPGPLPIDVRRRPRKRAAAVSLCTECDRPAIAKERCMKHYQQQRRAEYYRNRGPISTYRVRAPRVVCGNCGEVGHNVRSCVVESVP